MATSIYSNTVSLDVEDEEPLSLSDLVRTGETSRLRRRGAIAGRHLSRPSMSTLAGYSGNAPATFNPPAPQYQQANRQIVQAPALPPPWVDSGSSAIQQPWSTEISDPTKADDDVDGVPNSGYALYCGVETWEFGDEEPYEPSLFPSAFDDSPPSTPSHLPHRIRRSTGCGALIHSSGKPRPKSGTWQACGKASVNVIPMDKIYFERGGQAKLFSCGCRWHGVGCSKCGNPLGNVYMPCQVATTTSSMSRDPSRPSRPTLNPSAHFVYTFFGDAVSPSPEYEFPKGALEASHSHRTPYMSTMDSVAQSWDGTTEYSYGYAEPEQEQEQEEPGAEYDPDGVLIANEPGSPDKPSAETMLWPAR
ncbi:hypothetical protein ACEPAH_5322 [Sanghuangporus vaninii]